MQKFLHKILCKIGIHHYTYFNSTLVGSDWVGCVYCLKELDTIKKIKRANNANSTV